MSGGSGGEKTEKATPKKRKKARHDGHVGNTPELGAWAGMLVATFVLPRVARSLLNVATRAMIMVGAVIRSPDPAQAMGVAKTAMRGAFLAALPLAGFVAVAGVLSVAAQGSLWFSAGLLKPKFSRLNPLSGIKRMFGKHGLWTLVKSLIKTSILAVVLWIAIRNLVPTLQASGSMTLSSLVSICVGSAMKVLRWAAISGLLMACADFIVVRKRNDKQLKMSKQEIKDEFKSSEGDPLVRSGRRARQMAMRRNRMMADVPTADVVVVNPTHVAVALRYDPKRGAPRVVAKGGDHVAARIRALAEEHRVPMVADIPLARALHAGCAVGDEIPPDLYRAVATVIAFIMTLRRRGSVSGVHTVRTLAPAR